MRHGSDGCGRKEGYTGISRNKQRGTWQVDVRYMLQGRMRRIREDFGTKTAAETRYREVKVQVAKAQMAERLGLILPTEGQANREAEKAARTRARDTAAAVEAPKPTTFAGWWMDCRAYYVTSNRPTTVGRKDEIVRLHLMPDLGDRAMVGIRAVDLENILTRLKQKGKAATTVRYVRAVLSHVFGRAERLGVITDNPMKRVGTVPVRTAEQRSTT